VTIRVGINGFGRIGRNFWRAVHAAQGSEIEIVAANDLTDPATNAHLLKYDTVLGTLDVDVTVEGDVIRAGDQEIRILAERDPAALPWGDLGVDVVIESTGRFTTRDAAAGHLTAVAPMAKVLADSFGIVRGLMTTIHAYTSDQVLQDFQHRDLRRARAAAQNIIPTTTGAAKATALVLPELKGKMDGISMRVPVIDGSVTDLVAQLEREVTVAEVNAAYQAAAEGPLKDYLCYSTDPIVSSDIVGTTWSCIFDSPLTMANGDQVKVVGWYDNEFGYSNRLADLVILVGSRLR